MGLCEVVSLGDPGLVGGVVEAPLDDSYLVGGVVGVSLDDPGPFIGVTLLPWQSKILQGII